MSPLGGSGEPVEAVVQAGALEIPYRRAGRGHPVVLLVSGTPEGSEPLLRRLADRFLVIQPLILPEPPAWDVWIEGLVDGLGLETPDLVVDRLLFDGVARLARRDRRGVGRVLSLEVVDR